MERLSRCLLIYYYLYVVLLYITMLFTIKRVLKGGPNPISHLKIWQNPSPSWNFIRNPSPSY
jgi:hypothetical protein